ncbi:hypothetical protein KNO81_41215 [Paraburkholderia sediminicola]|jgi:hypothetical protein|nr:hypothetical protein [Paraburkholderia sediminicola]
MSNEKKTIAVELNPDMIRGSMKLWRDSIDMKIPVADEFKIHFMPNRRSILERFAQTGNAWLMLLGDMTAIDDAEALLKLRCEIDAFGTWAVGELKAIDHLRNDGPGS